MERKHIDRILLGISVGSFFVMSVSFLLMTIESFVILPGLMFWLGLAFGVAFQIVLAIRRRMFLKAYPDKLQEAKKTWIGIFSFGSNIAAMIADISLPISIVAMVLAFVLTNGYGYACYVFIATTIFSFCMHCVLNGRIFLYAKNPLEVRHTHKKKALQVKERKK